MICSKCSHPNPENTVYCTKCGNQIGTLDPHFDYMKPSLKYVGPRSLVRSRTNRYIAGVCGGLADYYGYNATLIRAGFVLLFLMGFGFLGIIFYLILVAKIPESKLDPWAE